MFDNLKAALGLRAICAINFILVIGIWSPAKAGVITEIVLRSALGANDVYDWSTLPHPYANLTTPYSVASQNGLTAQVTPVGAGPVFSDFQPNPWNGNFADGDFLIGAFGGPFEITFAQPIKGLGAQIGYNACICPFVAHLLLFDSAHAFLGALTLPGLMNSAHDNSAIFIGAVDTVSEIKSAQFVVTTPADPNGLNGFAINRLSIASVPEPQSYTLIALGLAILAIVRRRNF
jgi:hypothetical protein